MLSYCSIGDGDYGKLGRGGSDGCKVPMRVESLIGLDVCKVECGSQFSVALTKSGAVFTWYVSYSNLRSFIFIFSILSLFLSSILQWNLSIPNPQKNGILYKLDISFGPKFYRKFQIKSQ